MPNDFWADGCEDRSTCRCTDRAALIAALHGRVLKGDSGARDEIAGLLLAAIDPQLRRAFPRASLDVIGSAADDAVLEYLTQPGGFDPSRGVPLERFVYIAAWRNLRDLLRSEARRQSRESRHVIRERLDSPATAHSAGDQGFNDQRALAELASLVESPHERRALRCWLAGRQTPDIALALGFAALAPEAQRVEVKRFKDRIKRRLKRRNPIERSQ